MKRAVRCEVAPVRCAHRRELAPDADAGRCEVASGNTAGVLPRSYPRPAGARWRIRVRAAF